MGSEWQVPGAMVARSLYVRRGLSAMAVLGMSSLPLFRTAMFGPKAGTCNRAL